MLAIQNRVYWPVFKLSLGKNNQIFALVKWAISFCVLEDLAEDRIQSGILN